MSRFAAIAITLAPLPGWVIAEGASYCRSRSSQDNPDDADAGNLQDGATEETVLCEGLKLHYKDEWKPLLAERLQQQ